LPDPAGALITDTSRPSVSAASAAAAWSSRSPVSVGRACVSGAAPVSAPARRARSAPSACAGVLARQLRRCARAGLRERARVHVELRVRRVPYAAVPLVDAATVRAPHARRNLGQVWRFQADHWLELGSEYPVR